MDWQLLMPSSHWPDTILNQPVMTNSAAPSS